jgi:hypothetical protein
LRAVRFAGLTEITRLAMEPAQQERKTTMSLKKKTETETKNPPAAKVRVGLITASIWENKTEKGVFYNVTFDRRYKDGDDWKSSHSYNADDLLALAKAADLAHSKIVEARNGDGE